MEETNARFIEVTSPTGEKIQAEILDIFNVEGYEGKDYILYSFGEDVNEEEEKVYVSILEETNDMCNLLEIKDEKEWETVQKALAERAEDIGGE